MSQALPGFDELAQKYLYRRDSAINPSLDNARMLLSRLGDPQDALNVIQLTGTNGKTSTTWMTAEILRGQGVTSAAYTSPHLISFTERLILDGSPVSEELLAKHLARVGEYVDELEAESEGRPMISGFEILTCAVLDLLGAEGVQAPVLEVGMGGRWDATSLAPTRVAGVTHIALDHTEYLGPDLESIAREKSQVFREGSYAVTAERNPELLAILEERTASVGGRLLAIDRDFSAQWRPGEPDSASPEYSTPVRIVDIRGSFSNYGALPLSIVGEHQVDNLALAVVAAEAFVGKALDGGAVRAAVQRLRTPGRFEILSSRPWVVLDGAHNPDAAGALARSLGAGAPPELPYKNLILVIGIFEDKDSIGILDRLAPLAAEIIATEVDHPRRLSAERLAGLASRYGVKVSCEAELGKALSGARDSAGAEDLICVTGSLYTVGAARALLAPVK